MTEEDAENSEIEADDPLWQLVRGAAKRTCRSKLKKAYEMPTEV